MTSIWEMVTWVVSCIFIRLVGSCQCSDLKIWITRVSHRNLVLWLWDWIMSLPEEWCWPEMWPNIGNWDSQILWSWSPDNERFPLLDHQLKESQISTETVSSSSLNNTLALQTDVDDELFVRLQLWLQSSLILNTQNSLLDQWDDQRWWWTV